MNEQVKVIENSKSTIVENYNDAVIDRQIFIEIEKGAELTYIVPRIKKNTDLKIKRTTIVHANAKIIWFDLNDGENNVESEIITKLVEPGARGETYGIFYGKNNARFAISHITEHLAPNTHSIMATKGVLDDKSHADIRSLIKIYPGMNGCTGHERADTLLLSRDAHVDAIPELEIGNNDVQCTHAVTTTRLSPKKLFYLSGRGLNDSEARDMLVTAHLESIMIILRDEGHHT